jgi:hypothetical protein
VRQRSEREVRDQLRRDVQYLVHRMKLLQELKSQELAELRREKQQAEDYIREVGRSLYRLIGAERVYQMLNLEVTTLELDRLPADMCIRILDKLPSLTSYLDFDGPMPSNEPESLPLRCIELLLDNSELPKSLARSIIVHVNPTSNSKGYVYKEAFTEEAAVLFKGVPPRVWERMKRTIDEAIIKSQTEGAEQCPSCPSQPR